MRPMYFLAEGQSAHIPDPRYQTFEDRSRFLNAIEIQTRGEVSGLEMQIRRVLSQINPDLAVAIFRVFPYRWKQISCSRQ